MALMDTERVKALHLQKKQTLTLTLQELSSYAEIQYKTFDTWIREGFVAPGYITTGTSAYDRTFTYDACFIILLLGQLEEAGFGIQKMRELMPSFLAKLDAPYGYMAVDIMHPKNIIHVEGNYAELSAAIREHFRYGNSSPIAIYDLNKIHIRLIDMGYDSDMRWEIKTAAMHIGPQADWTRIRELVTPIEDMAAYEASRSKPKKPSRFR